MKGYTAIAGWVRDVPAPVLADLYPPAGAGPAPPPSKTTIWRVVTDADAEVFDATVENWLMSSPLREPADQGGTAGTGQNGAAGAGPDDPARLMPVRLEGKTVRGAKDADGNQRHLLAALVGRTAQSSVVAAQAEVGVKTNKVPIAKTVLGQIDLNGKLVTTDALHTVKATAEFIHEAGGESILPVKENRKALFDALDALPWHQAPVAHSAADRGHGRITTRTIQVLPAPEDLPFSARQPGPAHRKIRQRPGRQPPSRRWPRSAWPAPPQTRPAPPAWSARSASDGRSSPSTGCVTPVSRRQIPGQNPVRAEDHGCSAQPGHLRPAPCACPDASTSPKPPDGQAGPWTGHSPFSA